ncbi:GNAT family N-acetyltransferase [Streptomyces sp. NPDC006879]|uniref:GNAT family N-acetyltransferase n=1 Tax=Streptomyces sp. NPDC006879 TaxID=3364767 RepID=UPI0036D00642
MTVRVRPMAPEDARAVATARTLGWQRSYAGHVPQVYLDAMDIAADTEVRRRHLTEAAPGVVHLVAERHGKVIGWACAGPYRGGQGEPAPDAEGEVYALYVHPDHQRSGAGRALLRAAVDLCAAAGRRRTRLWVLEGNRTARAFYERYGFTFDGASDCFEIEGTAVHEVRYTRDGDFGPERAG